MNLRKIESKLNEVQKRCRERTMSIEDVKYFVNLLKIERKEIMQKPVEKKYLQKINGYMEYAVPNSYGYRAYTTTVSGYITKYGRIVVDIHRDQASRVPYGGTVLKLKPIYE